VRASIWAGAATLAILLSAGAVRADVSIDRPGSIMILPKIVATASRDTVIQISNSSNTLAFAHCFYVDGSPQNPNLPAGPTNPPSWQETDFFITLTKQQPTHWEASVGRQINPTDALGSDGAGIDPGLVPPVPPGFTGELICIQVDSSATPVAGNSLRGEATFIGPDGDVSKYNSLNVPGIGGTDGQLLALDDVAYGACPQALEFTHIGQGAEDPLLGPGSNVSNRLTLIPCTHDFENQIPANVGLSIQSCDEFEDCFSGIINFQCWFDADLDDPIQVPSSPFGLINNFGPFKYARLTPGPVCTGGARAGQPCDPTATGPVCGGGGSCNGVVGLLGVMEATHTAASGASARGAYNLTTRGSVPGATILVTDTQQ
jgi:hypothetical protein